MRVEKYVGELLVNFFEMNVSKIPEREEDGVKTPDFECNYDNGEKYIIEVKEKNHNPELHAEQEEAFSNNEIFEVISPVEPRAVLEDKIRDGGKQISHYATDKKLFRIVWVYFTGIDSYAAFTNMEKAIYGKKLISVLDDPNNVYVKDCYYFDYSYFYNFKDTVDAVVLSRNSEAKICLNNFSEKYDEIRQSKFISKFEKGVIDPIVDVEENRTFIVDAPIPRKDKEKVFSYLREYYGLKKLGCMYEETYQNSFQIPMK